MCEGVGIHVCMCVCPHLVFLRGLPLLLHLSCGVLVSVAVVSFTL